MSCEPTEKRLNDWLEQRRYRKQRYSSKIYAKKATQTGTPGSFGRGRPRKEYTLEELKAAYIKDIGYRDNPRQDRRRAIIKNAHAIFTNATDLTDETIEQIEQALLDAKLQIRQRTK